MIFNNNSSTDTTSSSVIEPPKPPAPDFSEKPHSGLGKTIAIVILSITTTAFAGLFVWKLLDWMDIKDNFDTKVDSAVSADRLAEQERMEKEFAEREKEPNTTFTGPADYGELSFSYPKTWSLYVASDAAKGGEYTAYMNPLEVPPVSDNSAILSLRINIKNQAFDSVIKTYDTSVKSGKLTLSVINVNNGESTANVYSGALTRPTNASGKIAVIRIRDKTAIIQTDSELFFQDFEKILSTLTFNS